MDDVVPTAGTFARVPDAVQLVEMRRLVQAIYGSSVRPLPGLDVGRSYWGVAPGFRFGGDVVDVFHCQPGVTSLMVVDNAGHGIRAAMNASLAKYALRAYAAQGFDALDCVRALNNLCIQNSAFEAEPEFFATVFFAIIDSARRSMQYVSAGHDAAYVVTPRAATSLGATGPILGLFDDDSAFRQVSIRLDAGDIVVAATDGFSDARNEQLAFLGADALVGVIQDNRARPARIQAKAITRRALEYAGPRLRDDVAALVVKVGVPAR